MEIEYSETTRHKVVISHHEKIRVTMETLRACYDIPERAFIDGKGNLAYKEEHHGGTHSWDSTEIKRKATRVDKQILKILSELYLQWRAARYDK